MRVAVVAEETAQHRETDAAVRIRRLAELLASRRNDVRVFCSRWWEEEATEFIDGPVTYHAVTHRPDDPDRRLVTRLPAAVREFDPAIVHAAHANPSAIHGAKVASVFTRAPLLVDWYAPVLETGWRRRSMSIAAHVPDTVVTPSRLVQTWVRELGRPPRSIDVIPDSVDMDRIRSIDPEHAGDIVYARRLDEDSNLESLLLALAELRDVGWEAAIIGDGPSRRRYQLQVADLRIDDRVRFLGDLPIDRRLAIYKGAHVAVHTAFVAPFPTDFLRALACGCVGIAEYHTASSAHELIERRDRGFRVTNEAELAGAIRDASGLPRLEVDESFEAFDEGTMLERYLDCYRDLGAR